MKVKKKLFGRLAAVFFAAFNLQVCSAVISSDKGVGSEEREEKRAPTASYIGIVTTPEGLDLHLAERIDPQTREQLSRIFHQAFRKSEVFPPYCAQIASCDPNYGEVFHKLGGFLLGVLGDDGTVFRYKNPAPGTSKINEYAKSFWWRPEMGSMESWKIFHSDPLDPELCAEIKEVIEKHYPQYSCISWEKLKTDHSDAFDFLRECFRRVLKAVHNHCRGNVSTFGHLSTDSACSACVLAFRDGYRNYLKNETAKN